MFVYEFLDTIGNGYWIGSNDILEVTSFVYDDIIEGDDTLFMSITKIDDEETLNVKNITDDDGNEFSLNEMMEDFTSDELPVILCKDFEEVE